MPLKLPNLSVSNCQSFSICFNIDGSLEQAAEVIGDAAPQIRQPPDGPPAWFFGCGYSRQKVDHHLVIFARAPKLQAQYVHLTAEIRTELNGDTVSQEIRYITEERVYRYQREDISQEQIERILHGLAPSQTDQESYSRAVFWYPRDKYELDTTWSQLESLQSAESPTVYGMKIGLPNGFMIEFDIEPPTDEQLAVTIALKTALPIGPEVFQQSFGMLLHFASTIIAESQSEETSVT